MPPTLYAPVKLTLRKQRSASSPEEILASTSSLLNSYFQPFLAANFRVEDAEIKGVLNVQEAPRILQITQLVTLEMAPVKLFALAVGTINPAGRGGMRRKRAGLDRLTGAKEAVNHRL